MVGRSFLTEDAPGTKLNCTFFEDGVAEKAAAEEEEEEEEEQG
jgi:hypothetical protein